MVMIICLAAVHSAEGYDGGLRLTLAVGNFENNTFYKEADATAADLDQELMDRLQDNCSDVLIKRFGAPVEQDNQQIALYGRTEGITAVVSCKLTDIRAVEEELGFWFFEAVVYYVEVHALIEVYDTETASKIMVESFEDEVEIDREQFNDLLSKKAPGNFPAIGDPIREIAEQAADEICSAIEDKPFSAYVKAIFGDTVKINAGRDAGIAPGMTFKVHDLGEVIVGKDGATYYFKGIETGTIEIISVSTDMATGRVVSGSVSGPGVCITK